MFDHLEPWPEQHKEVGDDSREVRESFVELRMAIRSHCVEKGGVSRSFVPQAPSKADADAMQVDALGFDTERSLICKRAGHTPKDCWFKDASGKGGCKGGGGNSRAGAGAAAAAAAPVAAPAEGQDDETDADGWRWSVGARPRAQALLRELHDVGKLPAAAAAPFSFLNPGLMAPARGGVSPKLQGLHTRGRLDEATHTHTYIYA